MARFHLVDRTSYTVLPWGVLAVNFAICLAGAARAGGGAQIGSANIPAVYIFFIVVGAGTALLAVGLAVVYGLALAVLQVIEQATGGWGVGLHLFRVAYILAGPWYLTWLTSFVGLALMFVYGMWFGLVYRRWNLIGVLVFAAAQVTIGGAGAVAAAEAHGWPAIGRFFTTLSAAGLTGLLALLAVALLACGYATIRRVTV